MTAHSRFLTCAGYEIHFMEWGAPDAPPLVMWHGLARNGRDFDELAGALSDSYRVICPDTIGRGLSQWARDRERDYCFVTYMDIAMDLLDQLGIGTVRWVGTSMGGAIGIGLAAGPLKGRMTHLVANDIGPEVPQAAAERIASYVGNPPVFGTVGALEGWLRTVYAPFGDNPDSFWRRMAEASCRRRDDGSVTVHYDPKIVTQFTNHKGDLDNWPAFEAIDCPILLVRGADSDVLPQATAEEMVARNKHCRLALCEGYGHAPPLLRDDHVGMVRSFLA